MIKLYSTKCPKCLVLEKKLKTKGIGFEVIYDVDLMKQLGMTTVPQLDIGDNQLLDFKAANDWVNNLQEEK